MFGRSANLHLRPVGEGRRGRRPRRRTGALHGTAERLSTGPGTSVNAPPAPTHGRLGAVLARRAFVLGPAGCVVGRWSFVLGRLAAMDAGRRSVDEPSATVIDGPRVARWTGGVGGWTASVRRWAVAGSTLMLGVPTMNADASSLMVGTFGDGHRQVHRWTCGPHRWTPDLHRWTYGRPSLKVGGPSMSRRRSSMVVRRSIVDGAVVHR